MPESKYVLLFEDLEWTIKNHSYMLKYNRKKHRLDIRVDDNAHNESGKYESLVLPRIKVRKKVVNSLS